MIVSCVVERYEVDEEVEVPRDECEGEHSLRLSRDSGAAPRLPDFHQQNQNR